MGGRGGGELCRVWTSGWELDPFAFEVEKGFREVALGFERVMHQSFRPHPNKIECLGPDFERGFIADSDVVQNGLVWLCIQDGDHFVVILHQSFEKREAQEHNVFFLMNKALFNKLENAWEGD